MRCCADSNKVLEERLITLPGRVEPINRALVSIAVAPVRGVATYWVRA